VGDAFEFTFDPMLITLAPDPPDQVIPVRPNTILTPPSDGFFVLATCIFHADIATEGTVIRTKRCPNNLRIIAKNNLGCPDGTHKQFMDIMPTIMRNNKTAEDILKESMIACLSGLKSTCAAFEAAPAPESANPEKFAKLKSEVKLKCHDIETRIKDVGKNGLSELKPPKTQPEQLAILFNACEKGNALTKVVYFGTMLGFNESFLHKPDRLNEERIMNQINYIDYGVPKERYIPSKTYYLNAPFGFTRINNPLDVFIDDLYGRLHLAVGLRFGGESYTAQLDVGLRALKASDNPNTITLDEVVKLLVSPTLARRVVDLVCEKHPALDEKKRALTGLSEKEDTWQMALFDHGCSGIRVEGYPLTLHLPSRSRTDKTNKRNVVVLSAKARGSRPPRTQKIRLKKMKDYLTRDEPDDLFTTMMRKQNRSGSSSDETIEPSTPAQDLTDVESDVEGSSGGSKRRQCKRRQCKRRQTRHKRRHKRRQCKRGRTQRVRR